LKTRREVKRLFALYYFRWTGIIEELKEYVKRVREITNKTEGVELKGIFTPTSEWNGVLLFEGTSYQKILDIYKAYMQDYGPNPKIPVGKVEVLHTFEELGYPL
jgi:hypothetical protein